MVVMASARDLITIFVALELLSIPAYMLAGWRKRDLTGNEAGLKYYLMGVFASAVMLYGMSLVYGGTGTTLLAGIGEAIDGSFGDTPVAALGIVFVLVGFGFKVSAVPFHNWAPDTYEGAPTPITAFLSVASKAAGFVALMELIFVAFYGRDDIYGPLMFVLAAATMTVGNLIALRQTNVVRLLAYSSIAQAGFILAPLAVAGESPAIGADAIQAVVIYLIIYTVMNLGAFAVIVTVARKTGSAEMSTWGGLFQYAPGLTVAMTVFLFSLAGIPPLGGWFAKFQVFRTVVEADTGIGLRPRRRRRRELGDRALLLRQRGPPDVVRGRPRRRPHPDPHPHRPHPGDGRGRGRRVRVRLRPRHRRPLRRRRHRPPRPRRPLRRPGPSPTSEW